LLKSLTRLIKSNDIFADTVFNKTKHKAVSKNDFIKDNSKAQVDNAWKLDKDFFLDTRTKKVVGFICLGLALYFAIAFLSALFGNWKPDQSIVEGGDVNILGSAKKVKNTMGYMGAFFSYFFVYKWFGLAALMLPFVLIQKGCKLFFNYTFFKSNYFYPKVLFGGILLSLTLGFVMYNYAPIWAGGFGVAGYEAIKGMVGLFGFIIFLLLYFFIYLSYGFGVPKLSFLEKLEKNMQPINLTEQDENTEKDNVSENELAAKSVVLQEKMDNGKEKLKKEQDVPFVIDFDEEIIEPKKKKLLDFELITENADKGNEKEDEVEFAISISANENMQDEIIQPLNNPSHQGLDTLYDPTLDLSNYKFPPFDLLKQYEPQDTAIDRNELEESKNLIVETLKNYNIGIAGIKANIGPTITLYEVVPAAGVKISKIKNLEDDIALSLAALGIRIIAPIPGKGAIGIEVPNKKPQLVSMHSMIVSSKFQNNDYELPVCLGKTISNEVYVADMAKMPHLLMAGATGQGKSVGLNALIVSLLYKKHPATIKFVLVDPKKVELTLFNKIERHFLAKLPGNSDAIITDNKQVVNTLNSLCIEMDDRYTLLQNAQVRNIKDYNKKFQERKLNPNDGHKFLPYIIVIIDEVADLIMTAGKEVEHPIGRLAQLARAIGIHLVLATQRPSVNIITGTIKANFPARIAFRVTSKIDSRTILDGNGADQLIGRGDLLYSTGSDMLRLQCPFVDTPEVERICEYIGEQRGYPSAFLLPEYKDDNGNGVSTDFDSDERDALFDDAARVIVNAQQGSTSLIQRKMKIGYNRAGRIIDQLEQAGIVGPFEGSKAREVLIPDEYSLEQFLKNLDKQ